MTIPQEVRYYNDFPDPQDVTGVLGASYTLLVEKLHARRFFNVAKYDLEQFQFDAMQEPDVKIVAAPLPGIAIVREISLQQMNKI